MLKFFVQAIPMHDAAEQTPTAATSPLPAEALVGAESASAAAMAHAQALHRQASSVQYSQSASSASLADSTIVHSVAEMLDPALGPPITADASSQSQQQVALHMDPAQPGIADMEAAGASTADQQAGLRIVRPRTASTGAQADQLLVMPDAQLPPALAQAAMISAHQPLQLGAASRGDADTAPQPAEAYSEQMHQLAPTLHAARARTQTQGRPSMGAQTAAPDENAGRGSPAVSVAVVSMPASAAAPVAHDAAPSILTASGIDASTQANASSSITTSNRQRNPSMAPASISPVGPSLALVQPSGGTWHAAQLSM